MLIILSCTQVQDFPRLPKCQLCSPFLPIALIFRALPLFCLLLDDPFSFFFFFCLLALLTVIPTLSTSSSRLFLLFPLFPFLLSLYLVVACVACLLLFSPDFRGPQGILFSLILLFSSSLVLFSFSDLRGVWTLRDKNLPPPPCVEMEQAQPTYAHRCIVELMNRSTVKYLTRSVRKSGSEVASEVEREKRQLDEGGKSGGERARSRSKGKEGVCV